LVRLCTSQDWAAIRSQFQAAYLAAQCWDHDIIGRIMIAMKVLQESHDSYLQ
jgi:hypothetical protein